MNRLDWCNPGEWIYLLKTLLMRLSLWCLWTLEIEFYNWQSMERFSHSFIQFHLLCTQNEMFAYPGNCLHKYRYKKRGSYYNWLEKYFAQIQIQNTKKYICWPKQELWSMEKQLITTPPHAADNELNFCSMFCHSAVLPMIYAQRSNWGQLYWSGIVPRLKRW